MIRAAVAIAAVMLFGCATQDAGKGCAVSAPAIESGTSFSQRNERNQACLAVCDRATCIFGYDADSAMVVECNNAAADSCVCADNR